jgi:hypothetical protein
VGTKQESGQLEAGGHLRRSEAGRPPSEADTLNNLCHALYDQDQERWDQAIDHFGRAVMSFEKLRARRLQGSRKRRQSPLLALGPVIAEGAVQPMKAPEPVESK